LDTIQQEFDKQIQMVKDDLISEKEFEKNRNLRILAHPRTSAIAGSCADASTR